MGVSRLFYPLSSAQQGLWYAQQVDPENPIFNTAHYTEIKSSLTVDLFEQAVNTVLAQADGLRLRVIDQDQGPQQTFDAKAPMLEINEQFSAREQVIAWMQTDQQQPINLRTDPVARFVLFKLDATHFIFYMRIHHLAADGYAMNLIEARCVQHYLALLHEHVLPAPLSSITQVLKADTAYQNSSKYLKDRDFWLQQLSAEKEILSLSDRTALSASYFLYAQQEIAPSLSQRLIDFSAEHHCSWADVLTLLTAVYIARHTGQYESIFGVPYMGRMGNQSALAVATVMNIAPLALGIDEKLPIGEFLQLGSKALMQTRRHGRYRSEQLRRDLGLLTNMRRLHGPLINILPFDTVYNSSELNVSSSVLCAGPVEDINFTFRADTQAQGMRIEIEANPTLYEQVDINAHATRLTAFIEHALQCQRLEQVPTVTPVEFQHYVFDLNQTEHPVPATTLSHLIADIAQQHSKREAISDPHSYYNYEQYADRVEQLALQLHCAGIERGDIVAVAMQRRVEMVLMLHAIMRVGAAYLPLDLSQPRARLVKVLQQAQPRLCISDEVFTAQTELPCPLIHIAQLPAPQGSIADLAYPQSNDAAYVLFTSGSTGEPKGVVIQHQAIVNRLLWMRDHYEINPHHRFIQKTPYTFDVSLWELFLPFISGASLYVAPPEAHKDPLILGQLIKQQRLDVIHFVPSMLAAFLAEAQNKNLSIPLVFCSGEALSATLRAQFHQRIKGELHNLYGPTEAAVDVSYWPATSDDQSDPIPIGFPVWNTALYLLDNTLRPVPAGVRGDLYIGGVQLAQGYLYNPTLTAASFIPNPFGSGRIYKTGDVGRWRNDGAMTYLGRSDHQVKLRGLRIELGEIEHVLAQSPVVMQVAVIVREDQPLQQQVVAYVVTKSPNPDMITSDLLTLCRQQLPDYMVPNAVVFLDALPLSRSGKLDRNALPPPQRITHCGTAPRTTTERLIAQLFQQLLQLEQQGKKNVFTQDNFFALGGHSLLAAQLTAALKEHGYQENLGVIFAYPTVSQLAHYLDQTSSGSSIYSAGFEPVLTLHKGHDLTPALFCIHPAGGLSWCYGALARSDLNHTPVYGLQSDTFHDETLNESSLNELAITYADRIQSIQPQGIYHLLGWSVGGILAHAVAVELQKRQAQVGVLCLLDAYPSSAWRAQPLPAPNAIYKALLHIAGFDPNELPHVALTRQSVIDFLRSQNHPLGALEDAQLNGVFNAVAANNHAVRLHTEEKFNGNILFFRAGLDHKDTDLNPTMWRPWVEQIQVHTLPFLHAHLTTPDAIALINPILRDQLTNVTVEVDV